MKLKLTMFYLTLIIAVISVTSNLHSQNKLVIDGVKVNMRSKPSTNSSIVLTFENGAEIQFLPYQSEYEIIGNLIGKWLKILYSNKTGYVFSSFTKPYEFKDKQYISIEKARACCYKLCNQLKGMNCLGKNDDPSCDCGEECEAGGPTTMVYYGWTMTNKEIREYFNNLAEYQKISKRYSNECSPN
ncbi:SH3 domain-containing protein [Leptospira sp. 201903071]|uniref:SH3 domain-containing protein n=1 Tax=Leptospira ainazelensis TaxID=2810034 RepID=UPI0019631F7F|nr:SH3 domain-containing protein [Leptospira ainazelensis]MBM9500515.1 SH3 domain-containing protein [Leptospira ainazelensis]